MARLTKKGKKIGRPTLCTEEIAQKLLEGIREGQSIEGAAIRAGIAPRTYYQWKDKGENGEQPFVQFLQTLRQAEAEVEYETAGHWRNQTPDDWRAAKEFLERRFPDRWRVPAGTPSKIEAETANVIAVLPAQPGTDEWLRQLEQLKSSGNYSKGPKAS